MSIYPYPTGEADHAYHVYYQLYIIDSKKAGNGNANGNVHE